MRKAPARDSNSGSGTPAAWQSLMIRRIPVPNCSMYLIRKKASATSLLRGFDSCGCFKSSTVIPAGKPHPKAGHHHLLVDTPLPMNPGDKIPFNDFHRHYGKGQTGTVIALAPGKHTLRLLFADHDHRPYFVFSPELHITVSGPREGPPLRINPSDLAASCKAWYQDELSRPRPEGPRALIANLRDGEPVTSPFTVRLAVDGFGVAPKGHGGPGLGHFLLIRAVEHTSPAALAPFVYTQLVWSTLLAYLAFGEFPDSGSLIGMLVIVAGGLLAVNWDQIRRSRT